MGAVSGPQSPLSTVFRRLAQGQQPADAAPPGGSSPSLTALRKQLEDAQATLREHVEAGADEQTIRVDQVRVQSLSAALASALAQQAAAEKSAASSSTDLYL